MENYFNYFTEIEEQFQRRRGTLLILSPLDWALMETWKDAGIPLEAVLRGIDATFEKWERRPSRSRKVNGLAFCAQEVLAAAEEMKEAAVGAASSATGDDPPRRPAVALEHSEVIAFLERNAESLLTADLPSQTAALAKETARSLREVAALFAQENGPHPQMEDVERRLTVSEEKLMASLLASTPDDLLLGIRSEADRDLAPYRSKMNAAQIEQLHKQYLNKRLLDRYKLPRLSLFYM